jgi:hypothetical protein
LIANGCVPWPGPVPAPGALNVMTVGSTLKAVGARTPSNKFDVTAAASSRADVNRFVRFAVMFFSRVEFLITTLEDSL